MHKKVCMVHKFLCMMIESLLIKGRCEKEK
jgi:hypothetical protein